MNQPNLDSAFDELSMTPEARQVLKNYLDKLQAKAGTLSGDDQKELVRDIKEHLYNALEARLKQSKSRHDRIDAQVVLEVLSSLGEPEQYLESTQTDSGFRGLSPERRIRRAREGKVIGGVAMGFANYFRIDVVLVRALMVLLVFTGISIVLYPILWLAIPEESAAETEANQALTVGPSPVRRLRRAREGKVLGGVAMGIAHYLAIDVVLVRLVMVLLIITGISIIFYPILWLVIPEETPAESVQTVNSPIGPVPGWISIIGKIVTVLVIFLIFAALYLPVFLVLLALTIVLFVLPFVWAFAPMHMVGMNFLTMLGWGLPVVSVCLGAVFLMLLITFLAFVGRVHFHRSLLRGNSLRFMGAVGLLAVMVVIGAVIYASVGNWAGNETTTTQEFAAGSALTLTMTSDRIPTNIEIVGSQTADHITLTEIKQARGISSDDASKHAAAIATTMTQSADTLTVRVRSNDRFVTHDEVVRYRLVVPAHLKLDIANALGQTLIHDVQADDLHIANTDGLLDIENSLVDQAELSNRAGLIQLSNLSQSPALPLSEPLSAPLHTGPTLIVTNDVGAIRMDNVHFDQAAIKGQTGSIEVTDSVFGGTITNHLGEVVADHHSGELAMSSDVGSVRASFVSMQDDQNYRFGTRLGSIEVTLPAGLAPNITSSKHAGEFSNSYRARSTGPRPNLTFATDLGSITIH